MTTARKVGRWALVGVGGVVAVVVLLRFGVGAYLGTSGGRAMVADRLGSMVGLPVQVSDVDLGSRSSSVKFKVLDPALGTSPQAEVLSVENATADVSFAEIVTGRAHPKELHLQGASAFLRIGADGKILTTLPNPTGGGGELPTIVLDGARLTLRQEGRPEFTVSGVNLRVVPAGDKLTLSGTADDPGWGKWKLSGEGNVAAKTGRVELAADEVQLHTERLRSVPFVSPAVWEYAHPEGPAAANVRFELGAEEKFSYDVTLRPKGASLGVPPADVTLADVRGVVRIHDGLVEVSGTDPKQPATGTLAGGRVTVAGACNYSPDPVVIDPLEVTADHLAVKQLPAKWGLKNLGGALPRKVSIEDGFLSGDARLRILRYEDGRVEPYGGGVGKIDLPNFLGGQGQIAVTLGGDGQKLEFGHAPAGVPPASGPTMMRETQGGTIVAGGTLPSDSDAGVMWTARAATEGGPYRVVGLVGAALRGGPGDGRTLHVEITTERELLALVAFLAVQPPADPKAAPARTDQTNLAATITLRDIDIAQLIQQLELKVPYKVAGRVTVQAQFGVPLGQANTRSAYQLKGTLTSPQLSFEGLTVRDITTEVNYQDGKLTLTHLRGSIPQPGDEKAAPGTFSGTAAAAIDPPGDLTASLALDRLPLGAVAAGVPGFTTPISGMATGKASFKAPFEKLADPTTWDATATIRSDALTVAGRTAKGVTLSATVAKGIATLKDAAATIEGIPLTGSGTLTLSGKYPFDAAVKTAGTSITDLRRLVPEADLPVPAEGELATDSKVTGTLAPLTFTASGRVTASKLTLNKTPANHIDVRWEVTQDRLRLSDLSAGVFGGTLSGSLDYPFSPQKSGDFNLAFKDVDAAAAAAFVPDFPVRITGAVSGKASGTIPPAKEGQARIGNLDLDITAPKLTVQNIPAERLVGKATVKGGAVEYSLEGHTLGGTFEVKGRYPGAQDKKEPAAKPERGSIRLSGIDLAQLGAAVGFDAIKPLRGRLDAAFDYDNDLSAGSGRVTVRGLGWGAENAAQQLDGVLVLRDGVLELRDLAGGFARGFLRARGRVYLDNPRRNFLLISIDRADAGRLLAPIPELRGLIVGDVSVRVHGTVGRAMHGSGTVTVSRGTVGGAEVSELSIPFDYATSPGGYGRLSVREAATRAGSGRATGNLTLEWGLGGGARVGGQVRFIDLPLRAISPALGQNSLLGGGRITGRFDLNGSNVKSIDDVTGSLVARLTNASPKEIPVLTTVVPYLNPLGAAQPFQSGDVRGTLAGGVFRVQRLALANPGAQLFADGSITTRGQLDLNVVAHTGQVGPQAVGFRLLVSRLPVLGPIPIGLIRDVSNLVSNRTVRLTVTGTTANPVVRVNTGALLTEEAVRFLLTRYILPAEAAEALGLGTAGGVLGGTSGSK